MFFSFVVVIILDMRDDNEAFWEILVFYFPLEWTFPPIRYISGGISLSILRVKWRALAEILMDESTKYQFSELLQTLE